MNQHTRRNSALSAALLVSMGFSQAGLATSDEFKERFWYQDKAGKNHMTEADDLFGNAFASGDFDGDGYDDLATGVPGEEVSGQRNAGAVHVNYGHRHGLTAEGYEEWHLDRPYTQSSARAGDNYGYSLSAGDFNRDGYDDLAVGIPYRDVGSDGSAGAIHVLYGSPHGLTTDGNRLWHQDSTDVLGGAEPSDYFGWSLASADFNYDGIADLAIGVPGEDIDQTRNAGAVNILLGSDHGLTAFDNQIWYQGREIDGTPEAKDAFGYALAAGHFDGDRYADLAVGVPGEDLSPSQLNVYYENVGVVQVLYGSRFGLSGSHSEIWHQDRAGVDGHGDNGDQFGSALSAADFDGDTYDDLAVGAPYKRIGNASEAGSVTVMYGSHHGVSSHRSRQYHQDNHNIPGNAEEGDHFGRALAAGDLNGDGYADLSVGHPEEDLYSKADGGAVITIHGSSHGLKRHSHRLWHQNIEHVGSSVEKHDRFGLALTTGDFDGDGRSDLVIGVPFEDVDHVQDAGAFHVIYFSTFAINYGLGGAWANPETPDRGFMIEVIEDTNMVLIKWMTYAEADDAYGDERDQRWYTSLADYTGNKAEGVLESTAGGLFEEAAATTTAQHSEVGYIEMEFSGCATGMVRYEFDDGATGHFRIEKVTGASEHCQP